MTIPPGTLFSKFIYNYKTTQFLFVKRSREGRKEENEEVKEGKKKRQCTGKFYRALEAFKMQVMGMHS